MPFTVRPIDPLDSRVPIVRPDGRPTEQFARQWQLARTVNLTTDDISINVEELQTLIAQASITIAAIQVVLATIQSRQIIAGVALSGGGTLEADRTLNLEDTAVTPGTYGDGTNVPQITVDQQGRITGISNVAISFPP